MLCHELIAIRAHGAVFEPTLAVRIRIIILEWGLVAEPSITDRLDTALEKMRFRQMDVRAIYLVAADHDELDAAHSWEGFKVSLLSYEGHQIRRTDGARSRIYSTHGVEVTVAKRVSPRVKVAA